jgi:uncharacterized protein (DUF2461 family)
MFAGGGMWHPEPAQLAAWRQMVAGDRDKVEAVLKSPTFVTTFGSVSGDSLKRVPTGFAADHPGAELLKLKDVTFGRHLSDDEVFSPNLPDTLAEAFTAAVPLLELLARLSPGEVRAGWLRGG